jgi:acetylglutamate kinase
MKYEQRSRAEIFAENQAAHFIAEALPWVKAIAGKTVVIKYGGSAMVDEKLRSDVMSDIVLLKLMGVNPVIVHGGGAAISEVMERFGLPVEFVDGLRVTSEAAMDIVRMVLVGQVNQELVTAMNMHGNFAVGVSGSDAGTVIATQADPRLGRVGKVTGVSSDYIDALIQDGYIPVIASVAMGDDGGFFNVNADAVAGEIAAAIGAQKCVFLTDVDGIYEDFSDKATLISNMTLDEAKDMVASGAMSKGMIPKLQACITSLEKGVSRTHVINGTTHHAIILELLTDAGIGTVIHRTREAYDYENHPLGPVASKLVENLDERD